MAKTHGAVIHFLPPTLGAKTHCGCRPGILSEQAALREQYKHTPTDAIARRLDEIWRLLNGNLDAGT